MQRLGRLTVAVDDIALGKGREAEALLSGEPLGPPHRAAGVLLKSWAAAQAGDWKTALATPDSGGDRLITEVSQLNLAARMEGSVGGAVQHAAIGLLKQQVAALQAAQTSRQAE